MSYEALRRIDLNALPVLYALLETRSVTLAAIKLNMTQPSVSRTLARLRVALRDKLLVKSGGGMTPTARGEALVAPLRAVLERMRTVVETPQFDPKSFERVFRIATTDYGALALAPPLAAIMAKRAPCAGFELVPISRDAFRGLAAGDVDLALYSDDSAPDNLHSRALFDETYTCLVRRTHPGVEATDQGGWTVERFIAFPHALVTVTGGRTGVVDEALSLLGAKRRIAVWLPYFITAALLVARTDLILTLPTRAAAALAKEHRLVTFSPPLDLPSFGYRMLWHERTDADLEAAWLRDQMAEAARAPSEAENNPAP